jgi:glycosyltransferase involved in cell wall biosynthesis
MTIGLAIIARDEEHNLPTLLTSIEGAFDQVVLVDTGSTDTTVQTFQAWAERTGQPHTIDTFTWTDDFAAARNHADNLLETDWHSWADADDEIIGAHNLRGTVRGVPRNIDGLIADYDYVPGGFVPGRERLVRAGKGHWTGRLHEQQQIIGETRTINRTIAYWKHHRTDWTSATARNRRVETRWRQEDPFDWRRFDTERELHRKCAEQQEHIQALTRALQLAAADFEALNAA